MTNGNGTIHTDIAAELALLRQQNEALKAKLAARNNRQLSWKVSDKGGVSVYGLGRFPVSLYYSQWIKLLDASGDIRAFVETCHANGELATKDD